MKDGLFNLLKSAVEVNLRYSSIALNLSKEYIKDLDRVVREGGPAKTETTGEQKPTRRSPILLVGELNQEAGGAFVLNNTAATELNVNLMVQGEVDPKQVHLLPASFALAPGSSAVVRLQVKITDALEIGKDYSGAVVAPGLSAPAIEFVVRRLPADTASGRAKKEKDAPKRAAG